MGILNDIKNEIKKSGASKSKFLFFKEDVKCRVRFLVDFDDGMKVLFHDSYQEGINVPCQELYDRECKYCDMEGLRTRNQYIWSVWDYEAKEVRLVMSPVNNCSPVPTLAALYESYGTITDRDFVITRKGKQQNTTYAIIPMDKVKFKNSKAKPFSRQSILDIIDKAYPADETEEEEGKSKGKKYKSSDDGWDDDGDQDYGDMSAKELYELCKERDIDVPKKKPEKFYIKKLEEWDVEQEEEDTEDGWDDEWED